MGYPRTDEQRRFLENLRNSEQTKLRNSAIYKTIKKYILETYEKGADIPLDRIGKNRIINLAIKKYSLPDSESHIATNCMDLLIMDLCQEGILAREHSLEGQWYTKMTENETSPKADKRSDRIGKNQHISRKKKKAMKKYQKETTRSGEER